MILYALLFLAIGMLAVHTTRPRFRRRVLSAARFFLALPPPQKSSPKLTLNNPFRIPALYLRLLILALLILALLASQRTFRIAGKKQVHAWFLVDSSASMTTRHSLGNHWDAAKSELTTLAGELRALSDASGGTFRLSLFDMAVRDLAEGSLNENVTLGLQDQAPRQLGTHLSVLRPFLKQELSSAIQKEYTHLVIISDVAAPAWLADIAGLAVVWRDISQPGFNVGIDELQVGRNPLTGEISEVQVVVAAYGTKAPATLVRLVRDGNGTEQTLPVLWRNETYGTATIADPEPGTYDLELSQGGDYSGDDRAKFQIPVTAGLRVDWQLPDRRLPDLLGWIVTDQNPAISIGARLGKSDPGKSESVPGDGVRPFLWVGPGIEEKPSQVRDFVEASPLVSDIHFDVLERFRPNAKGPETPFFSHLRDLEGNLWVGSTENPRGIYVAGLPDLQETDGDRLLTTLFFNGLRWLVHEAEFPALYTLTSPQNPEPNGTRLNLHPGEGDVADPPISVGSLDDASLASLTAAVAVWPWLVTAGLGLFILERCLSLSGRRAWH